MQFAFNHMVAPKLGYGEFFDLALRLGLNAVEIRNDIPTVTLALARWATGIFKVDRCRSGLFKTSGGQSNTKVRHSLGSGNDESGES